jgi:hypothetical protein
MFPTRLRLALSVLAIAAIFAGPAMLSATNSTAEEAPAKSKKARMSGRAAAEARIKARAAKERKQRRAARAGKHKSKRAKARKPEVAKQQMQKPETGKQEMAKPAPEKADGLPTQTALSVQPSAKLAELVRTIKDQMQAGEADGSLTKRELARLASLRERVEIMERMSHNDERFSKWEIHYLEIANTILKNIVQRHRLDREMSIEPRFVEMRIQRGLQDGTLTERQAENLREIQRRILVARNEAEQGGALSEKDKVRYQRAQYRLSDLLNHTRRYGPISRTLGQAGFKEALERGIRNGSFSRAEARSLMRTHQHIVALRDQAIADGKITPIELTVLNNRLKAERHRLSYGERKAYRRSLRMERARVARAMAGGVGGGGGSGGDEGARGAVDAVRNFNRSLSGGMQKLRRFYGGR